MLFRPLRHFCTIIFKPKYLNNTILPPLGLIFLLLNTGVNNHDDYDDDDDHDDDDHDDDDNDEQ